MKNVPQNFSINFTGAPISCIEIRNKEVFVTMNNEFVWPNLSFDVSCFLDPLKGLLSGPNIEQIKPLVSNFHWDNMLAKLTNLSYTVPLEFNKLLLNGNTFTFKSKIFTQDQLLLDLANVFLNSGAFHYISLCITVYFMRYISGYRSGYVSSSSWFKNNYSYILSLNWVERYLDKLNHNKLYDSIIFKVYLNIKHLFIKFDSNLKLNKIKFISNSKISFIWINPKIILFSLNLNVMYASLSTIYVIIGWLFDFLSYIWMVRTNGMQWTNVSDLYFWIKRSIYSILYIIWLWSGIFTTNGVFFRILGSITNIPKFNIIITIIGSLMAYIGSSSWYWYGNPTLVKDLNLFSFVLDRIILPLIHRNFNVIDFNELLLRVLDPSYFNLYTSLRRSIIEWISFLGMVLSTYGSWSFYLDHVFYSIPVFANFLIWTTSSLILGFILIYLEDTRPRFALYVYGFAYLSFWSAVCFGTNSLLVGYITSENAASVLSYLLPINFLVAFVYPLPLYRFNSDATTGSRFLDTILFILLTSITLVTGGSLWYLIY